MQTILEWGISVIAWIQTARTPSLDHFFTLVAEMGSEYFYFAALPFICTIISRAAGVRIALTILASVMINSVLKAWVAEPRPFILDPSVWVITETGFGFPSGHTQQAALFWGLAIYYVRTWWIVAIGGLFVGVVGLSRLYLGVHYPTDVLGSIVIAAFILFNYQLLIRYGKNLWRPSTKVPVFGLVFAIAVLGAFAVPAKDMISAAGLGSGLVGGLLFSSHFPPLSASWRKRLITASLTAVVLALAYGGLKVIFPPKGAPYYELFSFIRYFSCGLLLSAFPIFIDTTRSLRQTAMAAHQRPN